MTIEKIGEEVIQHRAGERGPRVGKVETIRAIDDDGKETISKVNFWYQWETGAFLFCK